MGRVPQISKDGNLARFPADFMFQLIDAEFANLVAGNKALAAKMKRIERKLDSHDQAISGLIESVRHSLAPPQPA